MHPQPPVPHGPLGWCCRFAAKSGPEGRFSATEAPIETAQLHFCGALGLVRCLGRA